MAANETRRIWSAGSWACAIAGLGAVMLAAGRPGAPSPVADPVQIEIDFGRHIGPINPYIYGMALPGAEHFRQLRVPLTRWGGNPSTRYNWTRGNCWNTARDWHFQNVDYGSRDAASRQPSGVADRAIANNRSHGSETLLTIPTMGWVARDDNPDHGSVGVPAQGGPPFTAGSEAIRGYDPTFNRKWISMPSLPRKGRLFLDPPDRTAAEVYQDEWVYHLVRKFGRAAKGGVRFYAMDNEPDLWDATHTDMHPVQADYAEILERFLDYATAIKSVDPTASITGPVSWGWSGYFFSARDRGGDQFATHADRRAHGNAAFLPWFLRSVAQHDARTGRRSLDVLDVHYYPQGEGIYSRRSDPDTDARRLRSARGLWDPSYRDESWIDADVQLIPRLRQWVQRCYPGTRIGLTEWNWGAEHTLNGGLAVAEVLGILGREQVDLACYWTAPPVGSPAFMAYKMYRNADGEGHGFGDQAVAAASPIPDEVSCFAALDGAAGKPTTMLINKSPDRSHRVQLRMKRIGAINGCHVYRFTGDNLQSIVKLPDISLANGQTEITLSASSITLLRGI